MGFSGVATFFIIVVVLAVLAAAGWVIFTQLRARRLGLPPPGLSSYNPFSSSSRGGNTSTYGGPRPAPGGLVGWVNDRVRAFKNRGSRNAGGAYEEPLQSGVRGRGANRGFGPLDPDDAWDARVGTEADAYGPGSYYEEQDVGLHSDTGYAGAPAGYEEDRGRGRSREPEPYIGGSKAGLDTRYDEEMGGAAPNKQARNPFDDEAEPSNVSLRGVSPRPVGSAREEHNAQAGPDDSTSERVSMFRENV
ncbi:MAG: hypothetical protein M1818_001681 [Claussenomyces sp. TS43310]|nr:MAG: hypothetical protein M1818_001681 [Claussenomyces sp. TS43310]